MTRFWISWEEPTDDACDARPLKLPLPPSIPAWWESGYGDGYSCVCAVIDAPTEKKAKAAVKGYWKPRAWRFCETKTDGWKPGDRFPWPKE